MSRWVSAGRAGLKSGEPDGFDGPAARIVKYVPAEIVTAYTMLFGLLVSMTLPPDQHRLAAVGLMGLFLVITIVYVAKKSPAGSSRRGHLLVTPLSFLAWSYPISSALLDSWFVGLGSFFLQALVIGLSLFIKPREM